MGTLGIGRWGMEGDDPVRAVYDVSYARLVAQLLAICGSLHEAEDLVQEAFLSAMTHRRTFEEVANKEAWLRTAALNRLRNRWRRDRVVRRVLPRLRAGFAEATDLGPAASPDHIALVAALARLSPAMRETVVLHYVADLPVSEVARELDVPVGTVKARLARARKQLADLLTDLEEANHV